VRPQLDPLLTDTLSLRLNLLQILLFLLVERVIRVRSIEAQDRLRGFVDYCAVRSGQATFCAASAAYVGRAVS
jgi:hypothetical protein